MSATDGDTLPVGIENMLEEKRPVGKFPRRSSYPLYTRPKPATFIYLVEATHFDRLHKGWLKLISELETLECEALDRYAARYWSGAECAEACDEPWEFRVDSFKIIRKVAGPKLHFGPT